MTTLPLPSFVDGKGYYYEDLLKFFKYAVAAEWYKWTWATQLVRCCEAKRQKFITNYHLKKRWIIIGLKVVLLVSTVAANKMFTSLAQKNIDTQFR